jgi:hypothetical protein
VKKGAHGFAEPAPAALVFPDLNPHKQAPVS